MNVDECPCGLMEDPRFFKAVLERPELAEFHSKALEHLRYLEKNYEHSDAPGLNFPLKIAVDIPQGMWQQHLQRSESHISELECDIGSPEDFQEQRVRAFSTVKTMVVEKRRRFLDSEANSSSPQLICSAFRYSKNFDRDRRHIERENSASTFLHVMESVFNKYQAEFKRLAFATSEIFESNRQQRFDDNSLAAMLSMCDACDIEADLISKSLAEASEASDRFDSNEGRQSLCRLMETFVNMMDELRNEVEHFRRLSARRSCGSDTPVEDVELFV